MAFRNFIKKVQPMTIEAAWDYASALIEEEARGSSDVEPALHRLEARYGISPNQIMHLRSRRAKSCDVGLFARIKAAYVDVCERQLARLQHALEMERLSGDDANQDLARRLDEIAAELAARKAVRK
jgi:hypothetical protein